ncbi:RNA-directed DNA polymerase, eukaryota, reverse transcriptase zinc-binding domain protein [Tanacetum coccineum]
MAVRCTAQIDFVRLRTSTTDSQQIYGDLHWTLLITSEVSHGILRKCFCFTRGDVDWKSAKQSIFATLSAEAEYIAAFDASKEAVWVRKFIYGLGVVPTFKKPINMYCDNTRFVPTIEKPIYGLGVVPTRKARHFCAKVHYLREVMRLVTINFRKSSSQLMNNLADSFTKALAFPKHSELNRNIGKLPAIFCYGDSESVKVIKESLDEFSGYSGLLPNMQKSTVFFRGLSSAEQNILKIIPFTVEKLPVRYLSVPLITKQLSISDCKPLVNKVKAKIQVPILRDEIKNTAVWVSRNGHEKNFKISYVWEDMNFNETKVDWHPLVWFAQSILRHAFVTWLAIQKRLMTQDKLLIWRPNEDLKCALCKKCNDSHNHLFFTCDFSKGVWNELLKLLNVRLSECWDQIILEMKVLRLNKNIWSIVRMIVCNAPVYYIWQERNNRIFKNEKRDTDTILNIVKETVGMKLIELKVKESNTVKEVEEKWNIKLQRG